MQNLNTTNANSLDKERMEFIKQRASETRTKLLELAQKHNIYPKS